VPVTTAAEPAMTSPGRRAGYGPLRVVKAQGIEACARRNWLPDCVVYSQRLSQQTYTHCYYSNALLL